MYTLPFPFSELAWLSSLGNWKVCFGVAIDAADRLHDAGGC
jgi:hypothetical protein